MILDDTGHTVEELFETFDPIPIGAGMSLTPTTAPHLSLMKS